MRGQLDRRSYVQGMSQRQKDLEPLKHLNADASADYIEGWQLAVETEGESR